MYKIRGIRGYSKVGTRVGVKLKPSPLARPSIVYYIKLHFKDGLTLYKIGYTSMTIVDRVEGYYDRRTRSYKGGMGLPCGCKYKIISVVYKGKNGAAYEYEQNLHKLYVNARYYGPNRLRNGNTELYGRDVLGLDKDKYII